MDLNVDNTDYLSRALKPQELKKMTKKWTTLKSYIYIVQKSFPPFSNHSKHKKGQGLNKRMNLVKIGYSSLSTQDDKDKGFNRVYGLRTALISLNIHRAYLYEKDQSGDGKKNNDDQGAHKAEQMLHAIVNREYTPQPPIFKINFRSGNPTEWWHIPEKDMNSFLQFCDEKIFNDITPICVYGTQFTPKTSTKVIVDFQLQHIGVRYDPKKNDLFNKEEIREMAHQASKNAKTLRQRKADVIMIQEKALKVAKHQAERRKHTHNIAFWSKLFLGKTFKTEKKMWSGDYTFNKYPHKIISDVVNDKSNRQYIVEYEVDESKTVPRLYKRMTKAQRENAEGFMAINETLDEFPALKKKYQKEYDWYVNRNHYIQDIDYEEEG